MRTLIILVALLILWVTYFWAYNDLRHYIHTATQVWFFVNLLVFTVILGLFEFSGRKRL